ncbi:unnamed protein product [Closterium sp. Yama58-4]|nr:unnamed protein product [Closterium sp. Yama58-4]
MASGMHSLNYIVSCLLWPATRLWSLGARQIADIRANPKLVSLAVKSGLAATLAAVVCVLEDPIPDLSEIGIWAVVTVDLVFEPTVGSSLGKGINRTAGTLLAAVLAFGVNHATPHLGDVKPLFLAPAYSGDLLHNLLVSKLKLVATELNRFGENCVLESSSTDSVMKVCSDILFCQAEVDKHLSAIQFEPPHGRVFYKYPWKSYGQVLTSLQNFGLTLITVESSLHAAFQGNSSLRQDMGVEMRNLLHECSRVIVMLAASMGSFTWQGRPSLALLHSQNDLLKEKVIHSLQQFAHPKSAADIGGASDTSCFSSDISAMSPTACITDYRLMDGLLSPRFDTRMEHLQQARHLHGPESFLFSTVASASVVDKNTALAALPILRVQLSILEVLPNLVNLVYCGEHGCWL